MAVVMTQMIGFKMASVLSLRMPEIHCYYWLPLAVKISCGGGGERAACGGRIGFGGEGMGEFLGREEGEPEAEWEKVDLGGTSVC